MIETPLEIDSLAFNSWFRNPLVQTIKLRVDLIHGDQSMHLIAIPLVRIASTATLLDGNKAPKSVFLPATLLLNREGLGFLA